MSTSKVPPAPEAASFGGRDLAAQWSEEDEQFFPAYLDLLTQRILNHIEDFLPRRLDAAALSRLAGTTAGSYDPEVFNATLLVPIWDLLSRRGKCWRAMFATFLIESLGCPAGPYEQLICGLAELTHAGALIIDDIEDESLLRRGEQCIHLRYGVDVATNAGNALYFLPLLLLAEHPRLSDAQRLEIYICLSRFFVRAHLGQASDIYWSKHMTRASLERWLATGSAAQILQVYENKTAAPVEAAAEAAAIIADADAPRRLACRQFARTFGVAFQILDDVHNFSDSPDWTKTCGEDLSAGKLTYAVHVALHSLPEEDRQRLLQILCSPATRTSHAGRAEGVDLIRRSGALRAAHVQAQSLLSNAWSQFAAAISPSQPRQRLQMLCDRLLRGLHQLPTV